MISPISNALNTRKNKKQNIQYIIYVPNTDLSDFLDNDGDIPLAIGISDITFIL